MNEISIDAAVRVARFCWPDHTWEQDGDAAWAEHKTYSLILLDDVHDAENALRSIGGLRLAHEYGRQLWIEVIPKNEMTMINPETFYKLATASLEARVKALLRTIEASESGTLT